MKRLYIGPVAVTLAFLAAAAFAIGMFGNTFALAPKAQWIANGAVVLVVLAIVALLAVVVAAIFAGGIVIWSLVVDKANPFDSLGPNDVRSIKNAASVVVLGALLIGGLAGIPFAFDAAGLVTKGLHPWVTAEFSALGILLVGTTFGFLFGLPHYNDPVAVMVPAGGGTSTQAVATPLFSPSTNLEKISNQLVVLFSGAAFASLLTIPQYINTFSEFFRVGIQGHESQLLGAGIITYFGPLGFIVAYVVTRTVGAQAFARSDAELMGIVSNITDRLPPVPDTSFSGIGGGTASAPLSPTDSASLNAVVAVSFADLDTPEKLQTWGRAQFALGDFAASRRAFDRAYAMSPDNPRAVLDYATALYQDPSWTNYSYVLEKVKEADDLETQSPASVTPTLRARTLTLKAAADLYMPDGYLDAIQIVNDLLSSTTMPRQQLEHFYRACGLGQMAWAYANANLIRQGDADWNALIAQVGFDATVAMAISDGLRKQVLMVADPSQGRSDPQDCDLQYVAAADPKIVAVLKLNGAPPPPDVAYLPKVVLIPNAPAPPVGAIAAWIAGFP